MQKKQQSPHERKQTHLLLLLSFQAKCVDRTPGKERERGTKGWVQLHKARFEATEQNRTDAAVQETVRKHGIERFLAERPIQSS